MPRTILPMAVSDVSAFAKTLRQQIADLGRPPSHLEMLNLLSRAAGFRNYQHLRATGPGPEPAASPAHGTTAAAEPVATAAADARLAKTLRLFDADGRIVRWPTKRSQQELCLWFLWSRIPAGVSFSERQISALLNDMHGFGDPALLRRDLFDLGLVTRNRDGSNYRRVERRPPDELRRLAERIGRPNLRVA